MDVNDCQQFFLTEIWEFDPKTWEVLGQHYLEQLVLSFYFRFSANVHFNSQDILQKALLQLIFLKDYLCIKKSFEKL
jgi:hypothetical protein